MLSFLLSCIQCFPVSSNTECKSTDIELRCASASVDKTGDSILAVTEPFDTHAGNGQSVMKGPSPQPDEGDTSYYAIPFKHNTDEEANVTYTYARAEKSSKATDDDDKGSQHTGNKAEHHSTSPTAQVTVLTPDYIYAEVKKKAKPSPGTDKTAETTTLQASADEGTNVTYTYASVEKSSKETDDNEGSHHTATKAEDHSTSPTAQVTVLTPDYTYAEVKKKAKPSPGTDKTVKTTTLQESTVEAQGHETELPYLYATVNKQKPCMD